MSMEEINFEILQCVDRGLSIFGSGVASTTYWQLLFVHNLKPSEIALKPEVLSRVLYGIFGSKSASIFEKSIVRQLVAKFRVKFAASDFPTLVSQILRMQRLGPLEAYAETIQRNVVRKH